MKALPIQIELLEKVLVGDPAAEDPNTTGGLGYIPGSVLRGLVIGAFQSQGAEIFSDDLYPLLFGGDAHYLNAYPATGDQERTRPVPLFLRQVKDVQDEVVNLVAQVQAGPELQLVKLDKSYITGGAGGAPVFGYAPQMEVRLHNARPTGNAGMQDAQLFTYIALQAGQVMRTYIISHDEAKLKKIKALGVKGVLEADIGKSRHAEYGHIRLTFEEIIGEEWVEDGTPNAAAAKGKVVLTLLSDALVRDPHSGSYTTNLEAVFGKKAVRAFTQEKVIGGYNRTWGIPTPQARAISAGSAFVFMADDALLKKISKAVEEGIGERRLDGFGRVQLEWLNESQYDYITDAAAATAQISAPAAIAENEDFVTGVVERIVLSRARQRLAGMVNTLVVRRAPTNSQLSRLFRVLREERTAQLAALNSGEPRGKLKKPLIFIENLTKETKHKYDDALIEGKVLTEWIKDISEEPEEVVQAIIGNDLVFEGGQIRQGQFSGVIAAEYLMDVCKRLIKGNKAGG